MILKTSGRVFFCFVPLWFGVPRHWTPKSYGTRANTNALVCQCDCFYGPRLNTFKFAVQTIMLIAWSIITNSPCIFCRSIRPFIQFFFSSGHRLWFHHHYKFTRSENVSAFWFIFHIVNEPYTNESSAKPYHNITSTLTHMYHTIHRWMCEHMHVCVCCHFDVWYEHINIHKFVCLFLFPGLSGKIPVRMKQTTNNQTNQPIQIQSNKPDI